MKTTWLLPELNKSHIFLLNCDVCCSFPLPEMLDAHRKYGGMGTVLVIRVSAESASQFSELVADPATNELLHYTEKPETFVSDRINCEVYIFTPEIFTAIQGVSSQRKDRENLRLIASFEALQLATRNLLTDYVRLDQDILSPLTGKKQFYIYETIHFWEQIKTPGISLKCSALYLAQCRFTSPQFLASGDGTKNASIIGDVYVHPLAKIHPTAKLFSTLLPGLMYVRAHSKAVRGRTSLRKMHHCECKRKSLSNIIHHIRCYLELVSWQ